MASLPFHPGEVHLHKQLFSHNKRKGVDTLRDNPTLPGHYLPSFSSFLSAAPLYAVGTVDDGGKPWSGIWSNGVGGMAPVVGRDLLGLKVDFAKGDVTDPVLATLISGRTEEVRELKEGSAGIVVKAEGKGRMISLLAIDLEKRRRVKLAGRVLVAAVGIEVGAEGEEQKMGLQVVIRVEQCLGNCPKYLNSKSFVPVASKPELVSAGTVLSQKALNIVRDADMFFISSRNAEEDMDTNYRGGPAGFVRTRLTPTISTSSQRERHEVLYPEYSGNNLLQTLGNLYTTPVAGLIFPDFTTGDVLYVTGDVTLLFGSEAEAVMPRSNIVVKLVVTASRFVKAGLGVRLATAGEGNEQTELKGISPYNPKVRLLASELIKSIASQPRYIPAARQAATLLSQTPLSPTISRFAFALSNPGTTWKPGQYIILDFSNELDTGYSHMRDDDPRSLNDDFVRSFTVSSTPPPLPISSTDQGAGALLGTDASTKVAQAQDESRGSTFELTLRKISGGPVTEYLFKHGLSGTRNTTLPLEVGVKGFEGAFAFDIEKAVGAGQDGRLVFVASGVGITPLLAQLELLRRKDLLKRVLVNWSLRVDDLGFAIDVLERDGEFASRVKLFVTGEAEDHTSPPSEAEAHILSLQKLKQVCASIEPRRFDETDFKDLNTIGNVQMDQVLVCANPIVNAAVKQWLQRLGINAVTEDFAY